MLKISVIRSLKVSRDINITCQGLALVKLVHSQRAILERKKSEGHLRSLMALEACASSNGPRRCFNVTGRALDMLST